MSSNEFFDTNLFFQVVCIFVKIPRWWIVWIRHCVGGDITFFVTLPSCDKTCYCGWRTKIKLQPFMVWNMNRKCYFSVDQISRCIKRLENSRIKSDWCLPFCFLGHHPFEEFKSPISGIQLFRFREFLCDEALISV